MSSACHKWTVKNSIGLCAVTLVTLIVISALIGPAQEVQPQSVRFAVIGDYGFAWQPTQDVADLVKSWNPDFIITTGDNNYMFGEALTIDQNIGQYYHDFIFPYFGLYGPGASVNQFFPSLGNHDWDTPENQPSPYLDYFTLPGNERYYDFVWGPVHLFALSSDDREPDGIMASSAQGKWLQSKLATSSARWKIVYMHHPPYSSGVTGSRAEMQWPYEAWGVHAVLAGHDHVYERITDGDFPYFVNGLGGFKRHAFETPVAGSQVRYNSDYGAMLVEASDSSITFSFFNVSGQLIDSYQLSNGLPVVAIVTIVATDANASEPGTNTGTFTVSRTGSTSDSLTVNYTLAGTATNGSDYTSLSGSVTILSGSSTATITLTPIDDVLVESNETVIVTVASNAAYTVGTPGGATVTITDNDGSKDLVIESLGLSVSSVVPGGSTTASHNVANRGTITVTETYTDRIYLSTDQTYDAADILLGSSHGHTADLAPNATHSNSQAVTIPLGTAPGNYFILVRADALSAVVESNELNNVTAVPLTVPSTFSISGRVTSGGSGLSGVAVALSGAASKTTTSDSAGNYTFTGLVNGAYTVTPSKLGCTFTPTSRSMSIVGGNISGQDFTATCSGGKDLVIENLGLSAGSVAAAGGSRTVSHNVVNRGTITVTETYTDRIYLSTDQTLDAADTLLGSSHGHTADLVSNGTHANSQAVTIPGGAAPGNYFILVQADALGAVSESNEGNNITAAALTVTVSTRDLVIENLALSLASVAPGGSTAASHNVANRGTVTVTATYTDRIYLSTDQAYDAADILLGSSHGHTADLAPNATHSNSQAVTIPAGTVPGNYFILVRADALGTVAESDEGNNVTAVALTVP